MSSQFLAPALQVDEEELDRSLRPRRLDDFVGQERIKEQLSIALEAARSRSEALDHVLLAGPPGLGKTSLAHVVREELGVGIRTVAGPALERKDVAAILTSLEERDVLFIDEIHRLGRDVAEVRHEGAVTTEIAHEALDLLEVDEHGLERSDRALLEAITGKFGGGPVGLSTLAVALGEEPDTIEDVYEPYLLQLGFIQRTPRGRIVTEPGRAHLGATRDDDALF